MALMEMMMPAYGAAAAADVTIDATVSTSTARGMRSVVFTTASIGYWFYIDSSGTFVYSKTSNSGATWGSAVAISAQTTDIGYDVWFDQWTPGDSGTLIHTWCFDTGVDDIRYRTLDTSSDTLGTLRVVIAAASAVAGYSAFISGTKTRSGYLYCAYNIDAGAEIGLHRSIDSGTTWSANLSTTIVANNEKLWLFPTTGTGDDNDFFGIRCPAAAGVLTQRFWDNSAGALAGVAGLDATFNPHTPNTTDLTGQYGVSVSIRHSDGSLIIVNAAERDTATADIRVLVLTGNPSGGISGGTLKTNITTNIDDIYHPAVFIDQNTDNIYVAYNGKSDGLENLGTATKIYYVKSTDGGTTWGSETAYQIGTASANFQTWAPLSGPLFFVGWRVGTTLIGCAANAVTV